MANWNGCFNGTGSHSRSFLFAIRTLHHNRMVGNTVHMGGGDKRRSGSSQYRGLNIRAALVPPRSGVGPLWWQESRGRENYPRPGLIFLNNKLASWGVKSPTGTGYMNRGAQLASQKRAKQEPREGSKMRSRTERIALIFGDKRPENNGLSLKSHIQMQDGLAF